MARASSLSFIILAVLFQQNATASGTAGTFATLTGTVTYKGPIPKQTERDNDGIYRPRLTVNPTNAGLAYAVIYLEPISTNRPERKPGTDPESVRTAGSVPAFRVTIDQIDETFTPRVTAIQDKTAIRFTNSDALNHNVRSTCENPRNKFNIITSPSRDYEKKIRLEAGNTPIKLSCDIHQWMRAWIYVFDHPLFAVTNTNGQFRIDNIRPGKYLATVVQPDGVLNATREIIVSPTHTESLYIKFSRKDVRD